MTKQATPVSPRPDTRGRILDTAARLFSAKGFAATSIRDIASELCVTKAALYYHFASKEEILKEIISEPVDAVRRVLNDEDDLSTPAARAAFVGRIIGAMSSCERDSIQVFKDPTVTALVNEEVSSSGVTHQISVRLAMGLTGATDPAAVPPHVMMRAVAAVAAGYESINTWHLFYPDCDDLQPADIELIVGFVADILEAEPQRERR